MKTYEIVNNETKLKSIGFVLWQALIPGLVAWLLLDPQLDLLQLNLDQRIGIGYMWLISAGLLGYTLLTTWFCFFKGYHFLDQFVYSVVVILEFIVLYLTSNLLLAIFWRFLIGFSLAMIATALMTILVALINNYLRFKQEPRS